MVADQQKGTQVRYNVIDGWSATFLSNNSSMSTLAHAGSSNQHDHASGSVPVLADAKGDTAQKRCFSSSHGCQCCCCLASPNAMHTASGQLQHADFGCTSHNHDSHAMHITSGQVQYAD